MTENNTRKVIYTGIFFDRKTIEKKAKEFGEPLSKEIRNPHITLEFHPDQHHIDALKNRIGENVVVAVTAYGNDGINEGFKVDSIMTPDKTMREMFNQIASGIPHITTSVDAFKGKPVNTYKLFVPGAKYKRFGHLWLEGTVGAFVDGRVVTKQSELL